MIAKIEICKSMMKPYSRMQRINIERDSEYVCNVINPSLTACEYFLELKNPNLRACEYVI